MAKMPNRLRLVDGEVQMIDGSDLKEYLLSREGIQNGSDVVLLRRDKAEELLKDAEQWRLYQMILDDRFNLAS